MNSIGPFKDIVAVNFPTDGVAGQFIFTCEQEITLNFSYFTGEIDGTLRNFLFDDVEVTFQPGRHVIAGRPAYPNDPDRPLEIYISGSFQYTDDVENWTLYRFISRPLNLGVSYNRLILLGSNEGPIPNDDYIATAVQRFVPWFSIPAQPRVLDGQNLALMFVGCVGIGDLSNASLPNAVNTMGMFARAECQNWNKINMPAVADTAGMFAGANSMWSTNGDPVYFENLNNAGFMFYGSDISELVGSVFSARSLRWFLAESDIELVDSCYFEDSGEIANGGAAEIFLNCSNLSIVANSTFKIDRAGGLIDGANISNWENNLCELTAQNPFTGTYATLSFSSANIIQSDFLLDTGYFFIDSCTIDGCSFNEGMETTGPTYILNSTLKTVYSNGETRLLNSDIDLIATGALEIAFCVFKNLARQRDIIRFEKNQGTLLSNKFTGFNYDTNLSDIEVLDCEFTVLNNDSISGTSKSPFISRRNVDLVSNISSGEGSNVSYLFNLALSFNDPSDKTFGIREIRDSIIESSFLGHFIIQRRDIDFVSCFVTNLSPINEFAGPVFDDRFYYKNETSFLTNFDYKVKFLNSDIIGGKLSINCRSVNAVNSVIQEIEFCYLSMESLNQEFFDSLIDCRINRRSQDLGETYVFDFDVSNVDFYKYFLSDSDSKVTAIRNFKPKSCIGNITRMDNLVTLENSNFNLGSEARVEIDLESLEGILGCIFYKGLRLSRINYSGSGDVVFSNSRFGDPYSSTAESFGFEVSFSSSQKVTWFNNIVHGDFLPHNLFCDRPTGVVEVHPGSDFEFFSDSDGGGDYSDFIIDLSYIDSDFILPLDFVEPFSVSDFALGVVNFPKFVFGGVGANKLLQKFQPRIDYGLNIDLLFEIVAQCESASSIIDKTVFEWPYPGFPIHIGGGGEIKNAFAYDIDPPLTTEKLFVDAGASGTYYSAVYYVSLTPDNLAFCQNRLLTKSDKSLLETRLADLGFTDVDLGYTYEVKSGRVIENYGGNATAYVPDHIEIVNS